jgi:threonine synthase
MGKIKGLRCPECGWEPIGSSKFQCDRCAAVLEVNLELGHLTRSDLLMIRRDTQKSLWRWFEFFPVQDRHAVVSLGEGYTPLVRVERLGRELGLRRLYIKNDGMLPSGSLKDRSNTVGISRAVELGFDTVAVSSTGNGAASVAAYAAAAGLGSVVFMPADTDRAKIAQAYAYGANVVLFEGTIDGIGELYREVLAEFGWYDCLSTNPYRNEGKKSYAFELFDQMDEHVPDWIIHPTAGGAGIWAMWKGYQELWALGWAHRVPRLVAAQSAGAAPIVRAFEQGSSTVEPVAAQKTVAESIQVGNPSALGSRALKALRGSTGSAVACDDEEILRAQAALARFAGIFAEPAAAVSVAAAGRLRTDGIIDENQLVVCNITGHGLKQPSSVALPAEVLQPVVPELDAVRRRLKERD